MLPDWTKHGWFVALALSLLGIAYYGTKVPAPILGLVAALAIVAVIVERIPRTLVSAVEAAALAPWLIMAVMAGIYVVLGMFIESISMMLMTLPVTFPIIVSLGLDPLWFGVALSFLSIVGLDPEAGGHDAGMQVEAAHLLTLSADAVDRAEEVPDDLRLVVGQVRQRRDDEVADEALAVVEGRGEARVGRCAAPHRRAAIRDDGAVQDRAGRAETGVGVWHGSLPGRTTRHVAGCVPGAPLPRGHQPVTAAGRPGEGEPAGRLVGRRWQSGRRWEETWLIASWTS